MIGFAGVEMVVRRLVKQSKSRLFADKCWRTRMPGNLDGQRLSAKNHRQAI